MTQLDRDGLGRLLDEGLSSLPLSLSEVQRRQLIDYLTLLVKWNAVYNLTAVRDPAQMVTQHLLDCLAALPFFAGAANVLDVGSGGGLPGMVLAICGSSGVAPMQVAMIDTVHKKTAFLTQVKSELGLQNATVYTGRVEQLRVSPFDVITSRAFADLSDFLNWSGHLLADDGRVLALKGIVPANEMERLPDNWKVMEVKRLNVPGMNAERHLVMIERNPRPAVRTQPVCTSLPN